VFLTDNKYSVHRFWWLWLPVSVFVVIAAIDPFLGHAHGDAWMYAENGILETMQWLVSAAAFFLGLSCLRYCKGRPWIMAWLVLGALGSLYITLEEISYGQHLFKWETPEYWQAINDQNETNLHNTSSWFDQKPRLVLLIGTVLGGIILPFVRRYRPMALPARFNALYPNDAMFWIALCALLSQLSKKVGKLEIFALYHRPSEVNELFIYYFIFMYLLFMRHSLRAEHAAKNAT